MPGTASSPTGLEYPLLLNGRRGEPAFAMIAVGGKRLFVPPDRLITGARTNGCVALASAPPARSAQAAGGIGPSQLAGPMSPAWQQARSGTGLLLTSTAARPQQDRRLGHQIGHKTVTRVSSGVSLGLAVPDLVTPFDQGRHHVPGIVAHASGRSEPVRPTQPGRCADRCRVDLTGVGRAGAGLRPCTAAALVLRP